jgi:outer membrane protein
VLYAAVRNYNNARYDYILNNLRLQQTAGTLSPDNLQALSAYLNPNYDPDSDFLPPDLDKEIEANLRRR